jgi:LacI family transcriptional regulator
MNDQGDEEAFMPHNMENPLNREYSKPVDPAGIPQKAKTARAVTSRDVAREAGVSQSLVSLVLSNKAGKKIRPQTRAHVLAVARELGYRPNLQARAMKLRKARAIGLLSTWDTGSFVFPPVVNGLKEICDREGMALTLCTGRADTGGVPDYVAYYLENRIDGLVYLSHVGVTSEGTIARLMESRIPFVCAIGARDLQGVSSVDVDFLHNGRLAAEHLLATGCRHPLLYVPQPANYAERERCAGFTEAFDARGLQVRRMDAGATARTGNALVDTLRAQLRAYPQTDGFCACTHTAWHMLKAAALEGWPVPHRLRVISMDNDFYAPYLTPSLSTVDEPLEDIGREAGDMLLGLMDGTAPGEKRALPLRVTVRASSGEAICAEASGQAGGDG